MTNEIKIGNKTFKYAISGESNKTFVIFPGAGEDIASNRRFFQYYSKKYKTILFEYNNVSSVDVFFKLVETVLDKEGVKNFSLYGMSLGGFLAQAYARRATNVDKLILSHTGSFRAGFTKRKIGLLLGVGKIVPVVPEKLVKVCVKNFAGPVQGVPGSKIPELCALYNKDYLKSLLLLIDDVRKDELTFELTEISNVQTLIIRSMDDPLLRDEGILLKYFPNSNECHFSGAGHATPFVQFERFTEEIDKFLSS